MAEFLKKDLNNKVAAQRKAVASFQSLIQVNRTKDEPEASSDASRTCEINKKENFNSDDTNVCHTDSKPAATALTSKPSPSSLTPSLSNTTTNTIQNILEKTRPLHQKRQEYPHSFHLHTYKAPTYCHVCQGLLVGLWSQGLQCQQCGINTHRGQGVGTHDDCRAEALLTPCPAAGITILNKDNVEKNERSEKPSSNKLGDVIQKIRELAENPNFIHEVRDQIDKDLKAVAKEAITAAAVDEERGKNLKRLKEALVPWIETFDSLQAKGGMVVLTIFLGLHALANLLQSTISFLVFLLSLAPHHGFLSTKSLQLAALHDATVTCAFCTLLAMASAAIYYVAIIFQRKHLILDRFLRDAFKVDAETDFGITVAGAAERCQYWSQYALASSIISWVASVGFWHLTQPVSWQATAEEVLPLLANTMLPSLVITMGAGALAFASYKKHPS